MLQFKIYWREFLPARNVVTFKAYIVLILICTNVILWTSKAPHLCCPTVLAVLKVTGHSLSTVLLQSAIREICSLQIPKCFTGAKPHSATLSHFIHRERSELLPVLCSGGEHIPCILGSRILLSPKLAAQRLTQLQNSVSILSPLCSTLRNKERDSETPGLSCDILTPRPKWFLYQFIYNCRCKHEFEKQSN